MEDKRSNEIELPFGSPQGSCLSPLLFIILVADIDEWAKNSVLYGFADDTSASLEGDNTEDVCKRLEKEAIAVVEFMSSNNLVINPSKTCFLLNRPNKQQGDITISIAGETVKESVSERLLGMQVRADLKWSDHIQQILPQLKQRLCLIKRLKESLSKKDLIIIGEALFNSKIRYGLSLFGKPKMAATEPVCGFMEKIQRAQNNMMRTIIGRRKRDHVSIQTLLKETGYKSVNEMCVQHILNDTFSVINGAIPEVKKVLETKPGTYATRQKDNLNSHVFKRSQVNTFLTNSGKVWNALHDSIKKAENKKQFKARLKPWMQNDSNVIKL